MEIETASRQPSMWAHRPPYRVQLPGGRILDMGVRPLVMGVLNVTPDSFSDGGAFYEFEAALRQGLRMAEEGADIIDVGGESTRPGSDPVPAHEELRRVLPVVCELARRTDVPVSIDTQKAQVAAAALDEGAAIVNDVSALRADPHMAELVASRQVPVVLMHMQGTPKTMQDNPTYREVVSEVTAWLKERIEWAVGAGIARDILIVDPGFGFGKQLSHNLELLRRLSELHSLGRPILVGTSRKSMIGQLLNLPPSERLYGTLATVASAVLSGCHIVRVHDVRPAREVVMVCEAIRKGATHGHD